MVLSMTTPPSPTREPPTLADVPVVASCPPILTPGAARLLLELVRQAARYLRVEDAAEDAA